MKAGPILSKYFNTANDPEGYAKRPAGEFAKELKELKPDEKQELATLAAAELDVEVTV
jgi:hypothetical protein